MTRFKFNDNIILNNKEVVMVRKRKSDPRQAIKRFAEAEALRRKAVFIEAPEFFEHPGHPYKFRLCPKTGRRITVIDIKGALEERSNRRNRV